MFKGIKLTNVEYQDFSTYTLILISFTSSVLIGKLWHMLFNSDRIAATKRHQKHDKDYGLLYLAIALSIWGVSGTVSIFYREGLYLSTIKGCLSSVNSMFFLLSTIHFKFSPKWVTDNPSETRSLFVSLPFLAMCGTVGISLVDINSDFQFYPDFVLSISTVALLAYSLAKTFKARGFAVLSVFSVVVLLLLLVTQPAIVSILPFSESESYFLLSMYSRLAFIIVICLLAFSWAQRNFNEVSEEVESLIVQVSSLKEEVRMAQERAAIAEESANKDERDLAWKDIAMKAAHKIGNPINAIETYRKTLIRRLNAPDIKGARDIVNYMQDSITSAKHVLEEFRSMTSLDELKLEYGDIMKIIRQSTRHEDDIDIEIQIKNHRLVYSRPHKINSETVSFPVVSQDNTVDLLIDRQKIKQCFDELLANSIQSFDDSNTNQRIGITVDYDTGELPTGLNNNREYVKIVFEDNGKGIPEKRKTTIFRPFYTTYQHGTGLGLAIIQRIIELHEGLIIENGEPGIGARFEIFLPLKNT